MMMRLRHESERDTAARTWRPDRRVAHQLMATRLGLARRARVARPVFLLSLHHVPNLLRSVRGTARLVLVLQSHINYQILDRLLARRAVISSRYVDY